jgi:KDO2-lipid IV(A) lauroyltransferase
MLTLLGDLLAVKMACWVNFFGRPASTHKAVALLAIEHNVPIIVMTAARLDKPLQYYGMVEDIIYPEEYAGRADAVRAITQRYTTALERMVRLFPEQYFWLHRRWKHQPPVKKAKAAA